MAGVFTSKTVDRPLTAVAVLRLLQEMGRIDPALREKIQRKVGATIDVHPLVWLAQQQMPDPGRQAKPHTVDSMLQCLAETTEQPFYRIDPLKVDAKATTAVMSFAFARRHKILAVAVDSQSVTVASAEPWCREWESGLEQVLKRPVRRVLASPLDIDRYLVEFYNLSRSVAGARAGEAQSPVLTNLEQMLELGGAREPEANDQHIVSIVDWLLQYAFEQRASDIHVEPRRDIANVRFRIDGVLHLVYEFPAKVAQAVISRIKILGRMDLAEKRRPQDGRLKTRRPDKAGDVELRLSTLPTAFGEKLVMRIFDPEVLVRSFYELGVVDEDYARWHAMATKPHGILLVTGPTGSGKTTTLYSTLKQLAKPEVNVCTIEDPIEMVEPAFNQMQVQQNIDLDFASGVRALLRQDPDIIMIGEIRDRETAEMAVQAALTGHLVLSTLHTNDAPSAITRMLEIGIPSYLLKATVLGVMAQRLVRTLCPHCKQPADISQEDWQSLVQPQSIPSPKKIAAAVGCLECRETGYQGRQGIYEIMPLTNDLAALIGDNCDSRTLRRQALAEGMNTLRASGARKIADGMTTVQEVLRVAPLIQE
ncbi:MAG: GspE/PulE family protein [Pseudomonadales bacterium]